MPSDADGPDPSLVRDEDSFLREVNDQLAAFDRDLDPAHAEGGPGLFVFGVPRSGTTLLYQLIAYATDAGYVTNVAARFWRAPLVGLRLARALEPGTRPAFRSRVGRTREATGVHEFGYFWTRLFGYEGQEVRGEDDIEDWRWEEIEREVRRIHREFGGPVVHKNLTYAFHLPRFARVFPDGVFLYLERDPVETGLSILETRERELGGRSGWWSVRPLGGDIEARGLTPEREVAEQIAALRTRYERGLETVPAARVLRLRYRELCADPGGVLERVSERLGDGLSLVRESPGPFEVRARPEDDAWRAMAAALDAAGVR